MAPKAPLRAVAAGEAAPAKSNLSIVDAAERGTRLDELRAMRRRIAVAMDDPNTPARDLAALSRRQLEIGREIEAIVTAEDEDRSVLARTSDEDWDESAI